MSRIFISHSSKDHADAEALGDWLEENGHTSYFLDFDPEKGIAAGTRWEDELYKNLRLWRAVIALLSPNRLESRWCFAEVTQTRPAGKPVFLAKIAPCNSASLLPDVQHVDFDDGSGRGILAAGQRPRGSWGRYRRRPGV